jgi:hypothetical protein
VVYLTLRCDVCGRFSETRRNERSGVMMLRHFAWKDGWTNKHKSTTDLCPECSRKAEESKAKQKTSR